MRFTIGFLLVFISNFLISQIEEDVWQKTFQPEQLQSDFNVLVSTFEDIHPALYQYTSEEDLKKLEFSIKEQLKKPMNMMEFHVLIRQYISKIKCGHSMARPADEWYEIERKKPSRIPLDIFLIKDKVYVKHIYQKDKNVPIGSEIVSINGKPIEEILKEMYAIQERDGLSFNFRDSKVESIFKTFHHFLYGKSEFYQLKFKNKEKVDSIELTGGAFNIAFEGQVKDSLLFNLELKSKGTQYFEYSQSKIPVLDLNSFSRKDFKKFYKKMFKQLAESGSDNLVIDLRGNGGGFFPHGVLLLKYLMKENFTFDFYRKENKPKKNKNLKMPFASKMTKVVFATIPDSEKSDPNRNYQIRYKIKKKNHFDGQIFVLIDGRSFSMGSLVPAKLKHGTDAIIIGRETGGAQEGSNAVLTGMLKLPESKIKIIVPHYHFDHKVIEQEKGRGLVPDVSIEYTIKERLSGIDKEMLEALRMINSN